MIDGSEKRMLLKGAVKVSEIVAIATSNFAKFIVRSTGKELRYRFISVEELETVDILFKCLKISVYLNFNVKAMIRWKHFFITL